MVKNISAYFLATPSSQLNMALLTPATSIWKYQLNSQKYSSVCLYTLSKVQLGSNYRSTKNWKHSKPRLIFVQILNGCKSTKMFLKTGQDESLDHIFWQKNWQTKFLSEIQTMARIPNNQQRLSIIKNWTSHTGLGLVILDKSSIQIPKVMC